MCKHLAELLQVEQPLFKLKLEQMETASGNPGVDVRLTSEIISKAHQKTKFLGLDPKDTTGEELYQALKGLVEKHDKFLAARLGVEDPQNVQEVLAGTKRLIERLPIPKNAWVIKHSSAKRLLKAMPPKKVMKVLGYRSVDSMLKRASMSEVYGAIRVIESENWQEAFVQKYKKLKPHDFENRAIEIVQLNHRKWGKSAEAYVRKNRHNLTHLKEMGVIVLLPMPITRLKGISITVLPLMLHYINEIRLYSAYFKMQQVVPEFGALLCDVIQNDLSDHVRIAGQPLHWRVVHRHFGNTKHFPDFFEPHVQPEDLVWRKAEEVLYRIEPALKFWHDMDFVATMEHGQMISFNLLDVAVSYVNDLPYGRQLTGHFQDSLWNELLGRYVGQKALERQMLSQLNKYVIETEPMFLGLQGAF